MSRTAEVVAAICAELARAQAEHGPMRSAHEGYAVIAEELDELWDEVKAKHQDVAAMESEAIQVATTALRFVLDVCRPELSARNVATWVPPDFGTSIRAIGGN